MITTHVLDTARGRPAAGVPIVPRHAATAGRSSAAARPTPTGARATWWPTARRWSTAATA